MIHPITHPLDERGKRHPANRSLLRAALCLCTCSLATMQALLAQVPSNQNLTAPAITTGSYNYMATSDISASGSFTVNTGAPANANVIFTSGQMIHLEP